MAEIAEADRLFEANEYKELHEYLLQFAKTSEDPELLWRSARAHRNRSTMADVSEEQKKQLVYDGFDVAERALKYGEDNYASHKWYGVLLSRKGDYDGTKVKIANAITIKEHFMKAVELNPSDATSHYLIGMWCFNCANLSWMERTAAKALFGTPPTSTFDEALQHFLKAEQMSPGFYIDNQLMIGKMYVQLSKKADAKEWFHKASNFDAKTDEDREKVKEAQKLL